MKEIDQFLSGSPSPNRCENRFKISHLPALLLVSPWESLRTSAAMSGVTPVSRRSLRALSTQLDSVAFWDTEILGYLPQRQVRLLNESDRVFFELVVKSVNESSHS